MVIPNGQPSSLTSNIDPNLSPFLGIGWLPLLLSALGSHLLGYGVSDAGKWLDEKLNIGPGEGPPLDWGPKAEQAINLLTQEMPRVAHISQRQMTKEAGIISAILRSGKIAGLVVKGIGKLITALLGVFAVASADDFVKKLLAPAKEHIRDVAPEYLPEGMEGMIEQKPADTGPTTSDEMADYLEKKYKL